MDRQLNDKEVEDLIFDGNISDIEDLIDDTLQDGRLDEETALVQIEDGPSRILFDTTTGAESIFPDLFENLELPHGSTTLRRSSRLSTAQPGIPPGVTESSCVLQQVTHEHSYSVNTAENEPSEPQQIIRNSDSQAANIADEQNTVDVHLDQYQNSTISTCLKENEAFQLYMLDNELSDKNNVKWKHGTFLTTDINWYSPPPLNVVSIGTPVEYFSKYFTNELFELMVEQTNLYGMSKDLSFTVTNISEIKQMIGIMIMTGNLGFPRLRLYWDPLFRIPLIADNMQINRFFKLRQSLHVTGYEIPPNAATDKLWKVRPIYDCIRERCLQLPIETDMCIDEQMVPFKGHFSAKQYVPNKPTPWGIKLFVLCGKSGTVLDFIVYQGATTEYDYFCSKFGLGAGTVMHLSQRINVPNCRLYFDNYFTSFHLLEWLHKRGIYAVGTARVDRFVKPPLAKDKDMQDRGRGTHDEVISNEGKVVLTKWFDNKGVLVASNFVAAGNIQTCRRWNKIAKQYVEVPRPEAIKLYNESMGGVDKLDFLISLYRIFIRARKWTLRMIDHSIDLALTNSWLEYVKDAKEMKIPKKDVLDLIHFRQHVAQALVLCNQIRGKKRGRPSADSSPVVSLAPQRPRMGAEQRPIAHVRRDKLDHWPEFDDSKDGQRCKHDKCQKKTHFYCSKCNVHLCITKKRNCFKSFHQ